MSTALAEPKHKSLIETMAARCGIEPDNFFKTVKETVFNSKGSMAEMIAFMVVANRYNLDPFTREIYAFPKTGGGIQTIVAIDGWLRIINSQPELDGIEYKDTFGPDGKLESITCRIYRKDRAHPIECTEYMSECKRNTSPWNQWPRRMLRHKATIQAARIAFSLSGIVDPDEAERIASTVDEGRGAVRDSVKALAERLSAAEPPKQPERASEAAEHPSEAVQDAPADEVSQEREPGQDDDESQVAPEDRADFRQIDRQGVKSRFELFVAGEEQHARALYDAVCGPDANISAEDSAWVENVYTATLTRLAKAAKAAEKKTKGGKQETML